MDAFKIIIGIIGFLLLLFSVYSLIVLLIKIIKKEVSFRRFLRNFIYYSMLFLFSIIFILLFLLLQTFSVLYREEKIGEIYALRDDEKINIVFIDLKNNKKHVFSVDGDQWVVEGEIIVFDKWLRWLGVRSYYRISRFSGRFLDKKQGIVKIYEINPKSDFWEFILNNFEKLPFIDTAYGICAFQYPGYKYDLYISDLGFIIRK